jgi:hypothetical protein
MNDQDFYTSIVFSTQTLKDEADQWFFDHNEKIKYQDPYERDAMQWLLNNATQEQMESICAMCIEDDALWDQFRRTVLSTIQYYFQENVADKMEGGTQ